MLFLYILKIRKFIFAKLLYTSILIEVYHKYILIIFLKKIYYKIYIIYTVVYFGFKDKYFYQVLPKMYFFFTCRQEL